MTKLKAKGYLRLRAAAGGRLPGDAQLDQDGLQRGEPGEAALEQLGADEGGGRPFALQEAEAAHWSGSSSRASSCT